MSAPERIRIPFRSAISMVWNYVKIKICGQIKALAFIILYLIAFKIIVLNTPPANALRISCGIGMVVFGLTFFLEGLFLGLMPLGERVGMLLPTRFNIPIIMIFGLMLGVGATLAEPAIASLRLAGVSVTPWETPLLYRLLELETDWLLMSIGAGVGVAVALGMVRFYYGISIKPFIYIIVSLVLCISVWFSRDASLSQILNLAWDTGGVTTGPVTVPLILAMGIGISRSVGRREGGASGFGVVTLASLLPPLCVLTLGAFLNHSTPQPVGVTEFFSSENRSNALKLVPSETDLRAIAFRRGNETARRAFFSNEDEYFRELRSLAVSEKQSELLGNMSLKDWLKYRASSAERAIMAVELAGRPVPSVASDIDAGDVMKTELQLAFRAVIPLVLLLVAVLLLILRARPKHSDEVVLGIIFSLIGMAVLTSGIRLGLAPLGDQVGRPLPQVFRSETHEEGRIILESFDEDSLIKAFDQNGTNSRFFYLKDRSGIARLIPFDPARYDAPARRYEHVVERPPLFGPELTLVGIGLVFLFAFGMGYGSTVAEPALSAMGVTVEELTVGTVSRGGVIHTVSLGVGLGLILGVARILYDFPMIWLLLPAYIAVIVLTWFSEDDFASIAWDSGGVTTGPITVPLILSMGLGIGGELNVVDGFGIVTMASVCPIMTMLVYGIVVQARQRRILEASAEEVGGNGSA